MTMTTSNTTTSRSDDDDNWSQVDLSNEFQEVEESKQQQISYENPLIEAVLRVTFAGFAGALVGLSRQNQFAGTKIFQRSVLSAGKGKQTGLSRAPPKLKTVQPVEAEANIPFMWATSFMVFVSILETSRFWSPTSLALNLYHHNQMVDKVEDDVKDVKDGHEILPYQKYWTTLSDFTIGGSVAGLAGAMSKRQPVTSSSTSRLELPAAILKTGRRSILLSGIGTGVALGFLAGVCQAGLDAAQDYVEDLEEEKQQQDEEEKESKELSQTQTMQQKQQEEK